MFKADAIAMGVGSVMDVKYVFLEGSKGTPS